MDLTPMDEGLHVSKFPRHNQAISPDQGFPSGHHSLLAIGSQRDVRSTGVFPREGPLRLAMSDNEETRGCHFTNLILFSNSIHLSGAVHGIGLLWPLC
jgi:hypothetical protein